MLLLGGAATAGVLYLDSVLLKEAHAQAAELSRKWGREIKIGGVATQLIPRLGVVVKDVAVGPGPDEPEPLATLERAEVEVPVMTAIRSRGRDLQVSRAEVSGLTVNIVKLPDGTQNVGRLLERIEQSKPPEEKKPEPATGERPTDLSAVRVDLAVVEGARIRFIDLGQGKEKRRELEVNQLNVKVRDLRAGQPLVVYLKAAVFSAAENLEVELHAAPLPPTLVPTPERLTIKAKAIDLGPLGPFLGEDVGLEQGTLDADWSAELGAAVPGGEGPTALKGTVRVAGLHFKGAEGGKALDVSVRTDVKGDVAKGDLQMDALDVTAGPVVAHGKGAVQGLMSDTPRVQGLEISIPRLDPAELASYVPALRKSLGDQMSGPASLSIRASGTAATQAIDVNADLTAMRLSIPKQLSKLPGAPMKVAATVSGGQRALRFKADANLMGVDLRPGGDIDKAPGQPLSVSAKGTFAKKGGATHVDLEALRLDVQQASLTGTAKIDLEGPKTAVVAQLESPRLDLDRLLYQAPKPAGGEAAQAPPPPPPKDPHRFDGLRIDAAVKVGWLHVEDMDMQNVRLEVSMVDDKLTVKKLQTGFYGGEVTADETSIQLGPPAAQRRFHANLKIRDVDVERAAASQTDKKFLAGRFTGDVVVDGVGTKVTSLSQSLGGNVGGELADGKLLGVDVFSAASALLAKALPFASQALQGTDATDLGKELPFSITIDHGVAQLKRPISVTRPAGSISLEGGARVDGTLDLVGMLNLSPETISKITRGKVVPTEPFPLPLKITGPAWKPTVSVTDLQTPVRALLKLAASEAAGRLLGDKGKQVADAVKGGEDKAKQEAEARAREEAEKAKKRLEEEAKKRLQNLFGGH
ncbi:MAG TPA: AsmA family protein [Myxococcaceae bacterium]